MRKVLLLHTLALTAAFGQTSAQLTLEQAHALALKNHPQVLASEANYQEAQQHVTETKSAYYPTLDGDITGSQANQDARIGAGYLTDSRMFNRFGYGITLSQLITDSGRTPNLVASSRLQAQASQQNYRASRFDVLIGVDQAYYEVLLGQGLIKVAQQTVNTRQTVADQVAELARNKLKSEVDVAFTQVNLSDAKLMLIRAKDRLTAAFAALSEALGSRDNVQYQLADQTMPGAPPADADALIQQAFQQRPELASIRLERQSDEKFVSAERDLKRPTVNFMGVAGFLPLISPGNANPNIPAEYEGAAVNVQIPVFNGHLFTARRQAAEYRLQATTQHERQLEDRITRDVRAAWARANTDYQALTATAELVKQANMALDLAQGRYNLGLSSVVELSQAQLGQTQAQVEDLNARYEYKSAYAALQYTIGGLR
jgi:outer membrane protein